MKSIILLACIAFVSLAASKEEVPEAGNELEPRAASEMSFIQSIDGNINPIQNGTGLRGSLHGLRHSQRVHSCEETGQCART